MYTICSEPSTDSFVPLNQNEADRTPPDLSRVKLEVPSRAASSMPACEFQPDSGVAGWSAVAWDANSPHPSTSNYLPQTDHYDLSGYYPPPLAQQAQNVTPTGPLSAVSCDSPRPYFTGPQVYCSLPASPSAHYDHVAAVGYGAGATSGPMYYSDDTSSSGAEDCCSSSPVFTPLPVRPPKHSHQYPPSREPVSQRKSSGDEQNTKRKLSNAKYDFVHSLPPHIEVKVYYPPSAINPKPHGKYSRRNNPELEKRRVHYCDHPG